ncbi:DUF2993 domain-containing protein [Actinoplanes sp. NPDC049118]|uniref:LmeA family phospholipid-binding protein n=1 Tax=Actinoplanes sp. NPDC049118 TaxID=3155769 RepID=UPI0033FC27F7
MYGSAKPRRRRGRALLITLGVLIVLILGLLFVADRVGKSFAEQLIADRVVSQLTAQDATAQEPDVTVEGVPFLTQVLSGRYQEIRIVLNDFSGPAGNGKKIDMKVLDIRAEDVTASLDTIRSGTGDIVANTVTGAGTITYANLADLIGREGLTLSERDGKLVGTAPIKALGQTFNASGTANIAVNDGVVNVTFADVTAEGMPDIPLVRAIVDSFVKQISVDLKVPALPLGMKVQKVEPTPEGLVVTAGANDVPLSSS